MVSSFSFTFSLQEQQYPLDDRFFSSCKIELVLIIRLGFCGPFLFQIQNIFVRLLFFLIFWFVHVAYVSMIKF